LAAARSDSAEEDIVKRAILIASFILSGALGFVAKGFAEGAANTAQITYDPAGRPTAITDSRGKSVQLTYCNGDRTHACDARWSTR